VQSGFSYWLPHQNSGHGYPDMVRYEKVSYKYPSFRRFGCLNCLLHNNPVSPIVLALNAGVKRILIFAASLASRMKHLAFLLLMLCGLLVKGQVTLTVQPADTTLCFRDSIAFAAVVSDPDATGLTYRWQFNSVDISTATDSIYSISSVSASDTGLYRCILYLNGVIIDTSNEARLRMRPRMFIDSLYRYNPLGCPGECKGQFKGAVSGGTPFMNNPYYIYEWHGGHSQDTIVFGLCPGYYTFTATDSLGCSIDSTYFVDVLKLPKISFEIEPDSVIYTTNPTIQVQFPDTMTRHITNWTWNFGDSVNIDNLNPARHTYMDTVKPGRIPISLSYTDLNGCDTAVIREIDLKVPKLNIPNLFTPNGDRINDRFEIQLMDDVDRDYRQAYLGNEFYVYDRWGKKVYEAVHYKSEDWDGGNLSDGTYFFVLKLTGQYSEEVPRGSITILRSKK
jgi:gliding motility-associated-like protein